MKSQNGAHPGVCRYLAGWEWRSRLHASFCTGANCLWRYRMLFPSGSGKGPQMKWKYWLCVIGVQQQGYISSVRVNCHLNSFSTTTDTLNIALGGLPLGTTFLSPTSPSRSLLFCSFFLSILSPNLCDGRGGDERLGSFALQLGEGSLLPAEVAVSPVWLSRLQFIAHMLVVFVGSSVVSTLSLRYKCICAEGGPVWAIM